LQDGTKIRVRKPGEQNQDQDSAPNDKKDDGKKKDDKKPDSGKTPSQN
jgi:hypothetical protein